MSATVKTYLIKHIFKLVLGQCGTFDIFHGAQVFGHAVAIFLADRLHLLPSQLLTNGWVVAEIDLRSDNQAWNTRTMVVNFGKPLFAHVLKRCGGSHGKTDQEYICLWV